MYFKLGIWSQLFLLSPSPPFFFLSFLTCATGQSRCKHEWGETFPALHDSLLRPITRTHCVWIRLCISALTRASSIFLFVCNVTVCSCGLSRVKSSADGAVKLLLYKVIEWLSLDVDVTAYSSAYSSNLFTVHLCACCLGGWLNLSFSSAADNHQLSMSSFASPLFLVSNCWNYFHLV